MSGKCRKCGGLMVGDLDMGNVSEGAARFLSVQVSRCVLCGLRIYPEHQTAMQMDKAEMVPNRVQQYSGGRKPGFEVSPADGVAVKFFDDIASFRKLRTGWTTIARLLQQATKKKFSERLLQKAFEAEMMRRGLA